jgi:hypothetical protein
VRYRRAFVRGLETALADRSDIRAAVYVTDSTYDARAREREYLADLANTRIALCPRGSLRDTYRLFEAARLGAVPICEPMPRRWFYEEAPVLLVRSWANLGPLLDDLLDDPVALRQHHEAITKWYAARWAPEPVGRSFAAFVDAG